MPCFGIITRSDFASYFAELKEMVTSLNNGTVPDPFVALSEVLTQEANGELTAWCWWTYPGTDIKGSGLIKTNEDGVSSEVITYYAKLGT